jgi:hypothetical protein
LVQELAPTAGIRFFVPWKQKGEGMKGKEFGWLLMEYPYYHMGRLLSRNRQITGVP